MRGGELVMGRADGVDVGETSGYGRPSRITQLTLVNQSELEGEERRVARIRAT